MKKLNITKEQFNRSNYFQRKYGKLEYVSESGKLFKTEKGNVLKFVKESCDEEFDRYYERMKKIFRYDSGIHIRLRDNEDGSETIEVTFDDRFNWDDDVVSGRIPLDEDYLLLDWITRFDEQAHRNGWEFDYELADDIEHPIDGGAGNDYFARLTLTCKCDKEEDDLLFENSSESGKKPRFGRKFKESTKRFGKKFNEGGNPAHVLEQDLDSLKEQCNAGAMSFDEVEDILIGLGFKLDHGGTPSGKADDDSQWMVYEHPEGYCAQLAYEFVGRGRHKIAGNVVDFDWIYDDSIKSRYNESGRKFKESASDIANDPAYKCPYCGSHDCEFDTAEDIGTGLTEGYFDGATFIAQYFCNKCGKPYNVQFQLKVKDVYPNEDADEFGDKDVWDADEDIWDDNK